MRLCNITFRFNKVEFYINTFNVKIILHFKRVRGNYQTRYTTCVQREP